jgi:hypothetical protein
MARIIAVLDKMAKLIEAEWADGGDYHMKNFKE